MLAEGLVESRACGLLYCLLDAGAQFGIGRCAADGFDGRRSFARVALDESEKEVNGLGQPGKGDGAQQH